MNNWRVMCVISTLSWGNWMNESGEKGGVRGQGGMTYWKEPSLIWRTSRQQQAPVLFKCLQNGLARDPKWPIGQKVNLLVSWLDKKFTLCHPVISLLYLSLCSAVVHSVCLLTFSDQSYWTHQLRVRHRVDMLLATLIYKWKIKPRFIHLVNSSASDMNVVNQMCTTGRT